MSARRDRSDRLAQLPDEETEAQAGAMTSPQSCEELVVEVGLDPSPQCLSISVFSSLLKEGIFLLLIGLLGVSGVRDPSGLFLGFESIMAWTENCHGVSQIPKDSPVIL